MSYYVNFFGEGYHIREYCFTMLIFLERVITLGSIVLLR